MTKKTRPEAGTGKKETVKSNHLRDCLFSLSLELSFLFTAVFELLLSVLRPDDELAVDCLEGLGDELAACCGLDELRGAASAELLLLLSDGLELTAEGLEFAPEETLPDLSPDL